MIGGQRVCVVMPAYNAARTLERTVAEIDRDLVDRILVVDDASRDATAEVARRLGLELRVHPKNRGYGGNQKTCYAAALAGGDEIVVMLHPDYQYTPKLLPAMASMIASGEYDVVLGSRILGGGALAGGMPLYKYVANRVLTAAREPGCSDRSSPSTTPATAPSAARCSNGWRSPRTRTTFVFDNQMLVQCFAAGFRVGELSCPTKYFAEASSINLRRSLRYGFGVLAVSALGALHRAGLARPRFLAADGRRLAPEAAAPDEAR